MTDSNETASGQLSRENEAGDVDPEKDSQITDEHDEETDDPAVLKKRLKDTQAKLTQVSQERSIDRDELMKLKGTVEAIAGQAKGQTKEDAVDLLAFLDDPQNLETLLDDPKNVTAAIRKVFAELQKQLSETFDARDRAILGEIERRDPTVREVASKVAELRKDPDYKELPDSVLAIIAKKGLKAAPKSDPGHVPGVSPGRRVPAAGAASDVDKAAEALLERMGYGKYDSK